jgi:hypothetical protein
MRESAGKLSKNMPSLFCITTHLRDLLVKERASRSAAFRNESTYERASAVKEFIGKYLPSTQSLDSIIRS